MKTLTLLGLLTLLSTAHAASPRFQELKRFKLGGDGGWDALTVDAPARRLYVARADRVMVIDVDSGALIGEIPGLDGAHAVALVPELGKGFATSGKTDEVFVFDMKTLHVASRLKVGEKPDIILYDPFSKLVFSFNGKSKTATALDPATLKISATITLPGKPEFAATDAAGRVFVNLEDKNELASIDAKTMTLAKEYPLAPCEEPNGLAYNAPTKSLLVGCGNKMAAVVDARTGKVTQTFKAGDHIDGAALDSARRTGFVSAGEGLLTIVTESHGKFRLAQQLKTERGAKTLAIDEKTGHVLLPSAQFEPAPAPKEPGQRVRPKIVPGTFFVLVIGQEGR